MKTSLGFGLAVCASAVMALGACKKKEDKDEAPAAVVTPAPLPAPAPVPPPPVDQAAAAPAPSGAAPQGSEVTRYPNETPMGNVTVRAVMPFNVYRGADLQAEKLGSVAEGTYVDVMSTYQNWILVNYPSGVGQLSPGWAPIPNINDRRLRLVTEKEKIEDPRWSGRGNSYDNPAHNKGNGERPASGTPKARPLLKKTDR